MEGTAGATVCLWGSATACEVPCLYGRVMARAQFRREDFGNKRLVVGWVV